MFYFTRNFDSYHFSYNHCQTGITTMFTQIRGNNWFYEILNPGKTEAILMVHGHPFDHTMWQYQYEALKDFTIILPDLRGYGKSDYDFGKIYIEEQALDLALLLDQLNIEEVHLIGLSMGGQIVIEFSSLFPHRTMSLVVADSDPSPETPESYRSRLQLANFIEEVGMHTYTTADIHKYLHPLSMTPGSLIYEHLFRMMIHTHKKGAAASHRGRAERRGHTHTLAAIKVPCLFVCGSDDYFTPVERMKDVSSEVPNADFIVIDKAGHMPNMEQPGLFNKAINKFYATITASKNPPWFQVTG